MGKTTGEIQERERSQRPTSMMGGTNPNVFVKSGSVQQERYDETSWYS